MSLQNSYTLRTATQDRPCFVCNKFTTLVLTVEDGASDWFYVCKSHISDTNFCHVVGMPPSPSPEVVKRKVEKKKNDKEEQPAESNSVTELMSNVASGLWNTIAGKKEEKQEKKENEKEKKDEKREDKKREKPKDVQGSFTGSSSMLPTNVTIAKPKYILNRDIFYLREMELKKRLEKKEAAERLTKLEFPAVPKTAPV